jgi:hypothetical protein
MTLLKLLPTNGRIIISDLQDGYVKNFILSDHVKGARLPYDLTPIDCMAKFKAELLETTAEIVDSNMMMTP